jgi:hypothetical protein
MSSNRKLKTLSRDPSLFRLLLVRESNLGVGGRGALEPEKEVVAEPETVRGGGLTWTPRIEVRVWRVGGFLAIEEVGVGVVVRRGGRRGRRGRFVGEWGGGEVQAAGKPKEEVRRRLDDIIKEEQRSWKMTRRGRVIVWVRNQ